MLISVFLFGVKTTTWLLQQLYNYFVVGPSVEGDNYLTPMELHAQNVYYAGNSDTKNFDTALVDSGELKPPQSHS